MSVEPRTLRTKAEEALAAVFAQSRASLPGGDAVRARRNAAFSLFEQFGLPHRRVEAWKYTDLRTLMRSAPPLAGPAPSALLAGVAEADPVPALDRAQVVIVNGVYEAELSDLAGLDGVTVESLAHVLATAPERVGRLVDDASDTAVALNTALMQGGVLVTVAPGARVARPVELVHLTAAAAPVSVYARSVVSVGDDASVRFVESHRGSPGLAYQTNVLFEVAAGERARVTWARLQTESEAAQHVTTFLARLGARSEIDHVAVNSGAALARWQGTLDLAGKGIRVGFSGATMLSGTEHGDTTLVITHGEPNQSSRELYKAAVDGAATGAFQGKIVVAPGAQKTDARMMARALLLSDRAEFASKPELEIFADDVQCGHGATAGQISDIELFYLMSRGIPRAEAERLLVEAFLDDAIDVAGDEAIGDALKGVVSTWLARRGT